MSETFRLPRWVIERAREEFVQSAMKHGYAVDQKAADMLALILARTDANPVDVEVVAIADSRAPARIWLLPHTGTAGETTWCDQPNPAGLIDSEVDAIEYVQVHPKGVK